MTHTSKMALRRHGQGSCGPQRCGCGLLLGNEKPARPSGLSRHLAGATVRASYWERKRFGIHSQQHRNSFYFRRFRHPIGHLQHIYRSELDLFLVGLTSGDLTRFFVVAGSARCLCCSRVLLVVPGGFGLFTQYILISSRILGT